MNIPIFDPWSIFWATLLDVIVDVIVFKLLKVRGITIMITILFNFLIPYLSFWFFIQSRPPLEQQVSALADFITNWMVNLVNFTISAVFGYIITVFIFIFSGGRTQEPEL